MGKKSKIGKQRKDKYYQLAKETGYRSRAAFKLIQLNRKFEFLQKSRVCIDLCAAPGGWMQVAKQNMPVSSIVVGVDLFPIKPIPGCICLTEDITSNKCRTQLQKELKTWKADVVLNDGAPNVGKNWLHDAYQQSCLTLSALKLATEFLRPGGWFVTKIFRSKDYHPLIWVLKQLFKKVHSTKPQASRSESAEIFVVCQYYVAPHKLDARFLDAKYVFEELDIGNEGSKINIFHPEKTKAKPVGYPEGSSSTHNPVTATDLILGEKGPLETLQYATEVVIDDDKILNHPLTTAEMKECCKDIKVLGRKDLRLLLNWCKSMKDVLKEKEEVKEDVEEEEIEMVEEDPEGKELEEDEKEIEEISERVKELQEEERLEARRKHKRMLREQRKLREKMNLKMVLAGDEGPQLNENIDVKDSMFDLKMVKKNKELEAVADDTPDILAREDVEQSRVKVVRFKDDEAYSASMEKAFSRNIDDDGSSEDSEEEEKEGLGLSAADNEDEDHSEDESDSSEEEEEEKNSVVDRPIGSRKSALITDLDARDKSQKRRQKAELWFQKSAFKDLEDDDDEDYEINAFVAKSSQKQKMQNGQASVNGVSAEDDKDDDDSSSDSDDSSSDNNESDKELHEEEEPQTKVTKSSGKDGYEIVPRKDKIKKRKLDAEALALGTLMVNSKKTKRDITDEAWNRYAFNDREGLPDWFVEEETRHMQKVLPVTKEMVDEIRARERELNARPIKKVVEAKARKKKRAIRRMDKARKKVENLMENSDFSEREKAKQVKQLYKKAMRKEKKEIKYVVAKKHLASKRGGRPHGHKGPYKVVDPRLKKDTRHLKTQNKKGRKGGGKRPSQRVKKGKQR